MTESAVAVAQKEGRATDDLAGKYLTFQLGEEIYGLEILKVQELIGLMPIASVPRTPEFVRDVITLNPQSGGERRDETGQS